jgi:hypothetical protein
VLVTCCALGPSALADDGPPPVDTVPATVAPEMIPDGVTIVGVAVGGFAPANAYAAVRAVFERPLTLVVQRHRVLAAPDALGAVGFARQAVSAALHSAPGRRVPLPVSVRPGPLRRYLRVLAAKLDRAPVDARLTLRRGRPFVTRDRRGARIDVEQALMRISELLTAGRRGSVTLPTRVLEPHVTRLSFGPLIVIHRGENRLDLYRGDRLQREFHVATGQTSYPTPLGAFSIVVKWKDPWWYPPASPWAVGEKPTPPGPGNPLGTRWMGLSAPGVGIHGTSNSGSIGYSLSHGCIRMLIPQAEWLFDQVDVGTPVFIVAS